MKQAQYTDEERRGHIAAYWKRKDKDPSYSIRKYSNEHGIRYYTFRDWYRSSMYNLRQHERAPECPAKSRRDITTASSLTLVRII